MALCLTGDSFKAFKKCLVLVHICVLMGKLRCLCPDQVRDVCHRNVIIPTDIEAIFVRYLDHALHIGFAFEYRQRNWKRCSVVENYYSTPVQLLLSPLLQEFLGKGTTDS